MDKNNTEKKPHSAEYFGAARDFWWNADFLDLMGKRLRFSEVRNVLDVGCGVGHWGQILAPLFSEDTQVVGVDREDVWIKKANDRAGQMGLSNRYVYQVGDVTHLPFSSGTFDLVTCQTVLIHLKDPKMGLSEMFRVLKPGGILLVAEPNNFANRAVASNLTKELSIEEIVDRMRFDLTVERGKEALGLGFNSIGDFISGYLAELNAQHIQVHLSDKATPFFAPYTSEDQQVNIQQMREWTKRKFIGWDREEVQEYFLAGGGSRTEFERYFQMILQDNEKVLGAMQNGTYHTSGGAITYLISARKPQ
jgi:ubiquinone/menaquinone biosynthesis C-methylase UbiE